VQQGSAVDALDAEDVDVKQVGDVAEFLGMAGVVAGKVAHAGVDGVPVRGERCGGEVADAGGGAGSQDDSHHGSPCRGMYDSAAGRQHHAEVGLARPHPLDGRSGIAQRDLFDQGADVGERREMNRASE